MQLANIPILSLTTYIPLLGALAIIFLIPKDKAGTIRAFATLTAVVDFAVSLVLSGACTGVELSPGAGGVGQRTDRSGGS